MSSQRRRFAFLFLLSLLAILGSIRTLRIHLPRMAPNVLLVGCKSSSRTAAVQQEKTENVYTRKPKRKYTGERLFTDYQDPTPTKANSTTISSPGCQKWAVVALFPEHPAITNQPMEITLQNIRQEIHQAQPNSGWCTVIVLPDDTLLQEDGGSHTKDNVHVVRFSQMKLPTGGASNKFIKSMMDTHTSTSGGSSASACKNAGYLYVLQHGASYILDLDYSAGMIGETWKSLDEIMFGSSQQTNINERDELSVDIPLMGGINVLNSHAYAFHDTKLGSSWPRGYPKVHEHPDRKATIAFSKTIDKSRIGVMHYLSSSMPDLDAQGSLMMGDLRPETNSINGAPNNPLLVPRRVFVPYNAKATLHTPETLWATLLPTSLPTRLADIWRSFVAQALFWDLDLHTVIVPPSKNPSIPESSFNNSKMMKGETHPLDTDMLFYTQVPNLLRMLEQFNMEHSSSTTSIPMKMEALWIHLYEEGFINYHDVTVMQLWLRALLEESPYPFPLVQQRPYFQNVVLMGQFNFATHPRAVTSKDLSPEAIVQLAKNLNNAKIKHENGRNTAGLVVEEDNTEVVAYWVQKWREVFSYVVVRGPFSKQQLRALRSGYDIKAHGMDESRWNHTIQDQGLYSPIANLVSTLEEFRHHPHVDGVMYIHDDMFLDVFDLIQKPSDQIAAPSSIEKFPSDNILASGQASRDSFFDPRTMLDKEVISRRAYNIHADGTFSKPNGQTFLDQTSLMQSLEYWPWNPKHCIPRLAELAQDDRVDPFRESIGGGEPASILIPPWEPSDFLFVPTRYAKDFIDIATLFLDHKVFLECALPTIVDMIRKRNADKNDSSSIVKTRNLCSSWDEGLRNTEGMITACLHNRDSPDEKDAQPRYGMYHPYKLSNGLSSWDAMFNMLTYAGLTRNKKAIR